LHNSAFELPDMMVVLVAAKKSQKNKQTLKPMMVVGLGAKWPRTKQNTQDHDGCRVSSQRAETQANPQHHDGCWVSSKKKLKNKQIL
jgi:hypothetical protein